MTLQRIAILGSRGIPARYGGFETFAQEIAVRLVSCDVHVTVYCENSGPADYHGVRLEYVKARNLGPFSTILFDVHCLWRARKGYDVVYMLGYGAALFCLIPRFWRSAVWINMDGIEWRRSKWRWPAKTWLKLMEWAATKVASRLIVDSHGIGTHLKKTYRSLPDMTMIPYGVEVQSTDRDPRQLRDLGLESQNYNLIVCRLEPENHVLEIVEGYEMVDTGIPLVVVGGLGQKNTYVDRLLRHASVQIRFIDAVYDSDRLWCLRQHCRIYFHGHSVGGTNPSLLEAMSAGNVVVAHDNVFNREVLGKSGYYFKNAVHLAELTNQAIALDALTARQIGQTAKDRAARRYSWESVCDAYIQLLRNC